jgi:hypothetical protein
MRHVTLDGKGKVIEPRRDSSMLISSDASISDLPKAKLDDHAVHRAHQSVSRDHYPEAQHPLVWFSGSPIGAPFAKFCSNRLIDRRPFNMDCLRSGALTAQN